MLTSQISHKLSKGSLGYDQIQSYIKSGYRLLPLPGLTHSSSSCSANVTVGCGDSSRQLQYMAPQENFGGQTGLNMHNRFIPHLQHTPYNVYVAITFIFITHHLMTYVLPVTNITSLPVLTYLSICFCFCLSVLMVWKICFCFLCVRMDKIICNQ